MQELRYWIQSDYDRICRINGKATHCYSKRQLHRHHAKGSYRVLHCTSEKGTAVPTCCAAIMLGNRQMRAVPMRRIDRLMRRINGYVQVGPTEFIAVTGSRIPQLLFLLLLLGAAAGFLYLLLHL